MDYFEQAMSLFSKGVLASGSLLTVWGIIQLGAAIKEHLQRLLVWLSAAV
ncbi:hypothetical protein NXO50_001142 [Enterococcus hirae]|nr:hypothetical protein [Enterococcus hirae]EMF0191798.1 hypothetical protein [Enterococcus hirae]EMF0240848.1 hypothetical protein [Enterococcus hirae]EMF0244861.1 hypothetical protein [Enterococcus hirae]